MTAFFRALFRSDDGDYGNVVMDLVLDDRRYVPNQVPCFGYWGKLKTRDLKPFIYQHGRLDFGDYEDEDNRESTPLIEADRYADFDLNDRIVAVGERFFIAYDRERWELTLERLTDVTKIL